MTLEDLGYNDELEKYKTENGLGDFEVGRVVSEHKERYAVRTAEKELEAEITGNLRFTAESREDFPAVGDWVAFMSYDELAIIHKILPRFSLISRQAVGKRGEKQIIASNIDYAFIIQAVDRDFNINRLQRYLTICNASNVKPIFLLSKIDLIDDENLNTLIGQVEGRVKEVPILAFSNETTKGVNKLKEMIIEGKTYCLLGSSGVGKSTLLNNLSGRPVMKTDAISSSTNKGRHVTSHRELVILENGGILIDNPGMREVGIADSSGGLEQTFDIIVELAEKCRFRDCTHISEAGCAVLEAVEAGKIDKNTYENYLKLQKEEKHYEATVSEKRKKDKELGKIVKNYKKMNVKKRF